MRGHILRTLCGAQRYQRAYVSDTQHLPLCVHTGEWSTREARIKCYVKRPHWTCSPRFLPRFLIGEYLYASIVLHVLFRPSWGSNGDSRRSMLIWFPCSAITTLIADVTHITRIPACVRVRAICARVFHLVRLIVPLPLARSTGYNTAVVSRAERRNVQHWQDILPVRTYIYT